jgi:outer membrane protein assembly factor BamB
MVRLTWGIAAVAGMAMASCGGTVMVEGAGPGSGGAGPGSGGAGPGGLKADAPWPRAGRLASNIARGDAPAYAQGVHQWTVELGWDVSPTSPVIDADGSIYVGCDQGLCAYSPGGEELWSTAPSGSCAYGSPAIGADGTIYSACGAVDSSSHQLKWPLWSTRGAINVGPNGEVVVTSERESGGSVAAFSPQGTQRWSVNTPGSLGTVAIGQDGTIYHTSFGWDATADVLRALDPSGSPEWTFDAGENLGTPIVAPDGSLIVPGGESLYALSAAGAVRWSVPAQTWSDYYLMPCAALAVDGTIYVGAPHALHAVSSTGEPLWSIDLPGGGYGAYCPVVGSDGTVYASPGSTVVYAVTSEGTVQWTVEFGDPGDMLYLSTPALGPDGTVYITNMGLADRLYAIGP